MRQSKAIAASVANSTAFRFSTGKAPGQSQAHRADIRVRRIAKASRAGAEDLRRRQKLDVDFESDDRLVGGVGGDGSVDGGTCVRQWLVVSDQIEIWIEKITQIDLRKISGINGLPTSIWVRIWLKYWKQKTCLQNIPYKRLTIRDIRKVPQIRGVTCKILDSLGYLIAIRMSKIQCLER